MLWLPLKQKVEVEAPQGPGASENAVGASRACESTETTCAAPSTGQRHGFLATGTMASSFGHSHRVGRKGRKTDTVFSLYKNCECGVGGCGFHFEDTFRNPILSRAGTRIILIITNYFVMLTMCGALCQVFRGNPT